MQKELTNYDQLHKVLRNASLVKIETPTGTITEQQQIESATILLFNKIWTSNPLNKEEIASIRNLLGENFDSEFRIKVLKKFDYAREQSKGVVFGRKWILFLKDVRILEGTSAD